jgi:hypothetical protein
MNKEKNIFARITPISDFIYLMQCKKKAEAGLYTTKGYFFIYLYHKMVKV